MVRGVFYLMSLLLIAAVPAAAYAQEVCRMAPDAIWMAVSQSCGSIGRGELCYGHAEIDGEGRSEDFVFAQVGDIVDAAQVEALTLSPYDSSSDSWGVAVLRIQATLPDTLPGQAVTILAFGDVRLENAVQRPSTPLPVTLTANGRMRGTPNASGTANIIAAVPAGAVLPAVGRDATGTWVYGDFEGTAGWISTQVLAADGAIAALDVLPDTPNFSTPMQMFYLKTGIGRPDCAGLPDNGILIQTPEGAGRVSLSINGVDIHMGSTLYLTAAEAELRVHVVEGMAEVAALGASQFTPAGSFVTVPLSDDGTAPVDAPSAPQPYDAAAVTALPVGVLDGAPPILPDPVVIAPPLPAEEIETAIADYLSGLTLEAGSYTIKRVSAVLRNGAGHCPPNVTFTLHHNGSSDMLFGQYARLPDGDFGANEAALNAARSSDVKYRGEANRLWLTSSTTLSWFSISNGDGDSSYCEFTYEGVRTE